MPRGVRRALQRKLGRSSACGISAATRRRLAASIAGAALLLALSQGVQAATITVNTNIPKIAADGKCSLVEAIVNANNDALTHADCLVAGDTGLDTIVLPAASTHSITAIYDAVYGSRLPLITSQIVIQGNGARIIGKKSKPPVRLITVAPSGDLTLDGVTLSGGAQIIGGAILNRGNLTISNTILTGNIAGYGGGIYNKLGTVLIAENTTISRNTGYYGGAIHNYKGTLDISGAAITGNKAARGGGISYDGGTITISNTVISRNVSSFSGGGMFGNGVFHNNSATLTIVETTISYNSTHFDGGGLLFEGHPASTVTIENSTIYANKAGSSGGGIANFFSSVNIENSTISGNTSKFGGGIWNQLPLKLNSSTITGNKAKIGGGLYNGNNPLTLSRTIVSGNKAAVSSEIHNRNGVILTANDYNLIGANGNAGISGFSLGASDIVPSPGVLITDILAPLADNGGPTLTHALVTGSPAIDATPLPGCPAEDQRGVSRPQGTLCDIGAFEK